MYVPRRRAERPQRGKFRQVVFGAGVERLSDDHRADDETEHCASDQSHTGTCREHPVVDAARAELGPGQHLAVRQFGVDVVAHLLDVGAGRDLGQNICDIVGRHVDQGSRTLERREDERCHRERADALGEADDTHTRCSDLRGVADTLEAEFGQIGLVHDHRIARAKRRDVTLDDVPGRQAAVLVIGADHDHQRRAAGRLAPVGEGRDQRNGADDARRGKRHIALTGPDRLRLLEILGAVGHDPQVAVGAVDHGDDHAARAEVEAELHGNQHDRKQNPDQRHGEADAVVEQIAKGQRKGHRDAEHL